MEKIKLSLWDTFAFVASSSVLHIVLISNEYFIVNTDLNNVETFFSLAKDNILGTAIIIIIYFLLSGMIFDLVANQIFDWLYKIFKQKKYFDQDEMNQMDKFIKKHILEQTGFEIKGNPYHFVKDYLTIKGTNSLFLVFLSKFGFYRSCTVIFIGVAVRNVFINSCQGYLSIIVYGAVAILSYKRARQFYDYQGPTLFRTYIMSMMKNTNSN